MYAEMAAASGGPNREYVNNAIESYKAATHADPSAFPYATKLPRISKARLSLWSQIAGVRSTVYIRG